MKGRDLLLIRLANAKQKLAPLGEPPASLTEEEQRAWRDIASSAPHGLLRQPDEVFLEMAARWVAYCRSTSSMPYAAISRTIRLLEELAISREDRRRLLKGAL